MLCYHIQKLHMRGEREGVRDIPRKSKKQAKIMASLLAAAPFFHPIMKYWLTNIFRLEKS
jgi:hypothetical protein